MLWPGLWCNKKSKLALGVKGHWLPLPILQKLLQEHGSSGKVRAVGFYSEGGVVIWKEEDESSGHGMLESIKGCLLWRSPSLHNFLSSEFKVELVLAEVFQDEVSDPTVLLQHFGVDDNVIKVYAHYTLHNEVPEDVIHHGLEGGGAVGESKEHNEWLEQSLVGLEGGLPLVSLLDMHIVVAPPDIQFSEVLHTPEVVDELGDEGEGVAILYCYGIENLIILN
ncbi:hypothetical protein C0989_009014 [Termitomyces sp. Mn162]|nr:hypothetical protein C0989_009014 [Termitomyces sp. Mn162]